jgi:IMP dehydrogenase
MGINLYIGAMMASFAKNLGLSFDDVLLIPHRLTFSSRFNGEVDLSTEILPNIRLPYPLISANMDTVTEIRMANKMRELGGLGIVHRFMPAEDQYNTLRNIDGPKVLCVGVGKPDRLINAKETSPDAILIDVAHGHSNSVVQRVAEAKEFYPNVPVIAGNVATKHGVLDLLNAGADCVKVGVGPGSLCTTRVKTGCGVPQLTAIMIAKEAVEQWLVDNISSKDVDELEWVPTIIADGGIKNSGDIIKALAAGADAVMVGSLFAGTDEAPGRIINFPGKGKMKEYRGMASQEAQVSWKGMATSVEGELTYLPYKGAVKDVFEDLINGMLSGMSYQDATNIAELRENAEFVQITSAGYKESLPHGIL